MKIRYRPTALKQLDSIFGYIANRNPTSAEKVRIRIKQSIERLAEFSFSGRASKVPEIRELSIVRYPYIVFDAVNESTQEVLILRVRHTSQDSEHHLDET